MDGRDHSLRREPLHRRTRRNETVSAARAYALHALHLQHPPRRRHCQRDKERHTLRPAKRARRPRKHKHGSIRQEQHHKPAGRVPRRGRLLFLQLQFLQQARARGPRGDGERLRHGADTRNKDTLVCVRRNGQSVEGTHKQPRQRAHGHHKPCQPQRIFQQVRRGIGGIGADNIRHRPRGIHRGLRRRRRQQHVPGGQVQLPLHQRLVPHDRRGGAGIPQGELPRHEIHQGGRDNLRQRLRGNEPRRPHKPARQHDTAALGMEPALLRLCLPGALCLLRPGVGQLPRAFAGPWRIRPL